LGSEVIVIFCPALKQRYRFTDIGVWELYKIMPTECSLCSTKNSNVGEVAAGARRFHGEMGLYIKMQSTLLNINNTIIINDTLAISCELGTKYSGFTKGASRTTELFGDIPLISPTE
jgi:hypothetical protein